VDNSARDDGAHTVHAPVSVPAALVPQRPSAFVERPRLRGTLDAAFEVPVTVLVAPAGSGKTTAVAAWSQEQASTTSPAVHWVAAQDVAQLAAYLLHAAGDPDPALPPQSPDWVDLVADRVAETFARQVAEAAADRRQRGAGASAHQPCVLVVDNAQTLSPDAVRLLTRVLTGADRAVRIILLSRRDLPFLPVRLDLDGHLQTLRPDDLSFTDLEARQLIAAHHPGADERDISAVLNQGRGWAAALVLAARTLGSAPDRGAARVSLRATQQPVLDYLLGEAFASFPALLRQVLVATGQEDQITDAEAVALSGLRDAPALLADAAEGGLLVTRYVDEGRSGERVWSYHPLLRELLRRRTSPTGPDTEAVVAAHQRAADYYNRQGDAERAVRHASLTGDLATIVPTLTRFMPVLVSTARVQPLVEALVGIPQEVLDQEPQLLSIEALLLRSSRDLVAAKRVADKALEALPAGLSDRGAVLQDRNLHSDLTVLEVWEAKHGWRDAEGAIRRAHQVLGCRHDRGGAVGGHDMADLSPLRGAWLMLDLVPLEAWHGDLDSASVHVEGATTVAHLFQHPRLTSATLAHRAMLELIDGAYQTAADTARECLRVAHDAGLGDDVYTVGAHLAIGWAAFEALDVDESERVLRELDGYPDAVLDPPLIAIFSRLLRARVLLARGRVAEARRLLSRRADVPGRLPDFAARMTRFVRMQAAALMGDRAAVHEEVTAMRSSVTDGNAGMWDAILLGLDGQEVAAVEALDDLLRAGPPYGGTSGAGAAVIRVAMLERIGDTESRTRARSLVPDVLSRVATQRLLWLLSMGVLVSGSFVDLFEAEAQRVGGHPFAGDAVAAMRRFDRPYRDLTASRGGERRPDHVAEPTGPDGSAQVLTHRELDVLHQLALGGNNADIARALFVSENTIKTHLGSIYRKLHVDRRMDALRVSRELGLLREPFSAGSDHTG
jgi:LuxR family maltose regulon positive regulatory protein